MDGNPLQQKKIPMDFPEALDRIGQEKEFLLYLIDLYKQEFLDRFSQLKQSVEKKEFSSIQEIGHSLKGSSANLSLPPLREIFWRMEEAGKNKDLSEAKKLFPLLKEEFERLEKFLQKQNLE